MALLLEGKVAVVTGAAQGLGLGMAEELGSQGATVVIADLQLDKAHLAMGRKIITADLNLNMLKDAYEYSCF